MKSSVSLLLAASLIGNIAFAAYVIRSSSISVSNASASAPSASASSARPSASGSSATTVTATGPLQWRTPRTDADMRDVVAKLRAAGYPPAILRAVVNQMLQDRFGKGLADPDQPFWKRTNQTPETRAAQIATSKEMNALREDLLGADGTPAASLSDAQRTRRFGNLSDDKINALLKLDQEYDEVRSLANAARDGTTGGGRDRAEQQRALEAEKRADLAAVLTPAELEQYDMRNSTSAQRMIGNLRNVDVSETEYAQLYQLQKTHDDATPERGETNGIEGFASRLVGQAELNEQAHAVLGDDRFYKYLEGADPTYASISRFTAQQTNISQATTYQLYQLQSEMQLTLAASRGNNSGAPTAERMAAVRASLESYNTKLQNLLGSEAADAYKKQGAGRMFSIMGQAGGRRNGGN
jgi:hypothetical protein